MELARGQVVDGRYQVDVELGRGGMGVVYKAYDRQRGDFVALKLVLPDSADEEALARFAREARLAAQVDKRGGIVRVYGFGTWNAVPYCAMEFVEGPDLETLFEQGTLDPSRLARLIAGVARSVAACHEAGIVHRDLKPANVLVGPGDQTKVADFGLARDAQAQREHLTRTGQLLGTPAYMAPEQVDDARGVDARADVYALGAILYRGLAGQPAFSGPSLQVVNQLLFRDPVPPSKRGAGVAEDLEAVCLKAMAKEPEHRYLGAAELADDLERFAAGGEVSARPVPFLTRFRRRVARREPRSVATVYALGAALLVGALGAVGGVTQVWGPAQVDAHVAWVEGTHGAFQLALWGEPLSVDVAEAATRRAALERVLWVLINEQKEIQAREAIGYLGAVERLDGYRRGGASPPASSEHGAYDLLVDALADVESERARRAGSKLEELLGAGSGRVRRYAQALAFRAHAAGGEPATCLPLALALLEGEPDPVLREWVQRRVKAVAEAATLEVLQAAPRVDRQASADALTKILGPLGDMGLSLEWLGEVKVGLLEEAAPEWAQRARSAVRAFAQGEEGPTSELVDHLSLLVRGAPAVRPGPELRGVLDELFEGALAAYHRKAADRTQSSRDGSDRRLADAVLRLANRFQAIDPGVREASPSFRRLIEDYYLKWSQDMTLDYFLIVLRTAPAQGSIVPSKRKLLWQVAEAVAPQTVLEKLDGLARLEPPSRAVAFLRVLVLIEANHHKDAAHPSPRDAKLARASMVADLSALLDDARWVPDLAPAHLGDAHLWLSKIRNKQLAQRDVPPEVRGALAAESAKHARLARACIVRSHRAECYEQEGRAYSLVGDWERCRELWEGAVELLRAELESGADSLGLGRADLAEALRDVGIASRKLGDLERARAMAREALKASLRAGGEGIRERCMEFCVTFALDEGRLEDAEAAFSPSLLTDRDSALIVSLHVRVLLAQGRLEEARREATSALETFEDPLERKRFDDLLKRIDQAAAKTR